MPGTVDGAVTVTRVSDRAGGVLLGMAVADAWSSATCVALCVGDAAATGLDLTDDGALGLLRRNLRELRLEGHASGGAFDSIDDILAAATMVALAHLHDTREKRADAARAVIAVVDEHTVVDDDVLRWVELVAETVRSGAVPDSGIQSSATATAETVDAAVQVVRAGEKADGTDSVRFIAALAAGTLAAGTLTAGTLASAMTGALLGARFGWSAVPEELANQARGWPGAGSTALVGIGILAARDQLRSAESAGDREERSGGVVPIELWNAGPENAGAENARSTNARSAVIPVPGSDGGGAASPTVWRRAQVVLTTSDADTATSGGAHDWRGGA